MINKVVLCLFCIVLLSGCSNDNMQSNLNQEQPENTIFSAEQPPSKIAQKSETTETYFSMNIDEVKVKVDSVFSRLKSRKYISTIHILFTNIDTKNDDVWYFNEAHEPVMFESVWSSEGMEGNDVFIIGLNGLQYVSRNERMYEVYSDKVRMYAEDDLILGMREAIEYEDKGADTVYTILTEEDFENADLQLRKMFDNMLSAIQSRKDSAIIKGKEVEVIINEHIKESADADLNSTIRFTIEKSLFNYIVNNKVQ